MSSILVIWSSFVDDTIPRHNSSRNSLRASPSQSILIRLILNCSVHDHFQFVGIICIYEHTFASSALRKQWMKWKQFHDLVCHWYENHSSSVTWNVSFKKRSNLKWLWNGILLQRCVQDHYSEFIVYVYVLLMQCNWMLFNVFTREYMR